MVTLVLSCSVSSIRRTLRGKNVRHSSLSFELPQYFSDAPYRMFVPCEEDSRVFIEKCFRAAIDHAGYVRMISAFASKKILP